MNLLVIGGSNSKKSINRQLANFTANLFKDATKELIDISQMDLPLYSVDLEQEKGIPDLVHAFAQKMDNTDLIILSLAENNGSFNVGLKNLLDWTSRIKDRLTFNKKAMLLMATSPGARGASTVLESAKVLFPYAGADVKASFSLPNFHQNFDSEKGLINTDLLLKLKQIIHTLQN